MQPHAKSFCSHFSEWNEEGKWNISQSMNWLISVTRCGCCSVLESLNWFHCHWRELPCVHGLIRVHMYVTMTSSSNANTWAYLYITLQLLTWLINFVWFSLGCMHISRHKCVCMCTHTLAHMCTPVCMHMHKHTCTIPPHTHMHTTTTTTTPPHTQIIMCACTPVHTLTYACSFLVHLEGQLFFQNFSADWFQFRIAYMGA